MSKNAVVGKSDTFLAFLVMRYEVWKQAANCSSFSPSHRSNLMPGSKASQAGDIYALQVVSCEKTNEGDKRGELDLTEREKRG